MAAASASASPMPPKGTPKKWLRRSDEFFVEALGCKDPPTFSTFEAALKAAMKLVDASNSSLFAFLTGAGGHVKDKRVLEKAHAIIERHKAVGRGPGLHAYFSQQVKQRGASGSPFEQRLGLATAANGCASVQELDSDSEEAEAEGSDEQNAAVKPELPQGEEDEEEEEVEVEADAVEAAESDEDIPIAKLRREESVAPPKRRRLGDEAQVKNEFE